MANTYTTQQTLPTQHSNAPWLTIITLILLPTTLSLLIFYIPNLLNSLNYGCPRKFAWADEHIIVTGGSNGLGLAIAQQALRCAHGYATFRLSLIDLVPPPDSLLHDSRCRFYRTDLSREEAIKEAWGQILQNGGPPSVLVNCAGRMYADERGVLKHGGKDVGTDASRQLFEVNLLAPVLLTQLFLSTLGKEKKAGTLVTVASVLGYTGAAHLAHYTASKAALIAFHTSLVAERLGSGLKLILVAPGQLDSRMFRHVNPAGGRGWLQRLIAGRPISCRNLARQLMVEHLERGRGGEIRMPWWANHMPLLLEALPRCLTRLIRAWSGMDDAMGRAERLGRWRPGLEQAKSE